MIFQIIATIGFMVSGASFVSIYLLESKTIQPDTMLFAFGLSTIGWFLAFIFSAMHTESKRRTEDE